MVVEDDIVLLRVVRGVEVVCAGRPLRGHRVNLLDPRVNLQFFASRAHYVTLTADAIGNLLQSKEQKT